MEFVAELGLLALGSRMRALSERLYGIADEIYRARGVPVEGRWFPVLRLLHDRGPQTVGDVAAAIGQTHSAVSQLADKLVRGGLVRVVADASDRRRRRLALTAKSQAALRDAKPAWRAIEDVLSERCASAGVDVLGALAALERITDATLPDAVVARCGALDRAAVRIVPFEPALREHFYRLNADWLRKYFYLEEIDHRVLSEPEREILEPGGAIVFALLGDAVVGTCALKREAPGVYELTKMAVEEERRGLGIGRALIEAVIAEFERLRGKRLFLESARKLAPAIRLYESVGFEHQAARKPDSHYSRSDVYMIWRKAKPARGAGSAAGAKKVATPKRAAQLKAPAAVRAARGAR